MCSLASGALGISVSTVWKLIWKDKIIKLHSNAIKPFFMEKNKVIRVYYTANQVKHLPNGWYAFSIGKDKVY